MRAMMLSLLVFSTVAFAQKAPQFRGELTTGERVSLSEYIKPDRVLFLSFWASWCVPCLEELTEIKNGLAKNADLPLDVLTVNVDTSETAADIGATIKLYGFSFPVVRDADHKIFSKYQKQSTLPYSVLINSKGEIVGTIRGLHEGMFEKLKQKVFEETGNRGKIALAG